MAQGKQKTYYKILAYQRVRGWQLDLVSVTSTKSAVIERAKHHISRKGNYC